MRSPSNVTASHVAAIRRFRKMRWNDAAIAKRIGITKSGVGYLARRYNIPKADIAPRVKRPCELVELPPICPQKAAQITEAKRDYWLNGGRGRLGRSEWVHPYARRRPA